MICRTPKKRIHHDIVGPSTSSLVNLHAIPLAIVAVLLPTVAVEFVAVPLTVPLIPRSLSIVSESTSLKQ